MAIKQASIIIVRGDGDGKGEEGPERRIVWQRGVFEGLGVPFSSCVESLRNVGVRNMGLDLACPCLYMLSWSLPLLLVGGLTPSITIPCRPGSVSEPPPRGQTRNRCLPCFKRSYQTHCNTRQTSTNT